MASDLSLTHSPKHPSCCDALRPQLGDFVEGELDTGAAATLEDHLTKCPACHVLVAKLKTASSACRAHLLQQVPAGFEDRMLSFLRKKCGSDTGSSSRRVVTPDEPESPSGDF